MTVLEVRRALLWCTLINYALILIWYGVLLMPHGWIYALGTDSFGLSHTRFDEILFSALVGYKILWAFFNLVPCAALYGMRKKASG